MRDTSLPVCIDAERAVLGGILLDNEAFIEAADLEPGDFSLDSHRRIYACMVQLAESSRAIDIVTLIEELNVGKELKAVGDTAYISSLIDGVPDRPSIESYVRIVRDKAALRRVIHACNATIVRAMEQRTDPLTVVRDLDDFITKIGGKVPSHAKSLKELIPLVLDDMAQERRRTTEWIGIPTGIRDLDYTLGGIRQSELWIVGGLPSSGKTSLGLEHGLSACCIADATQRQIPTCMFSMEMKDRRIVRRILAAMTPAGALGSRDAKRIPDDKWMHVAETAARLGQLPLYVDDSPGLTIPALRSAIRRYRKEFKIEFVLVDYVGLMDGPGRTLTEQATGIAKGLQRIAKEEGVAILALSQLHRPRDGNVNERPTMLSLKYTGDFEANADVVLLIYRPMHTETSTFTGEDEIIIGKARDGAKGAIPVYYDDRRLVFRPRTGVAQLAQGSRSS